MDSNPEPASGPAVTGFPDLAAAERFLRSRFGVAVSGLHLVGQGDWSRAFGYRLDGVDYVIRFGALRDDFELDRAAAVYGSAALPIPRIFEIGEALGGFYAISERVFGTHLDDLGEAEMRAVLPSLFRALDAMRLADLSGTTGYGSWQAGSVGQFPDWRSVLLDVADDSPAKRTYGWQARLAACPTGDGPFREGLSRMTALLPKCPEVRHLIHSDLLHNNVMVSGDRVSGVIDWGCSMYGDFLYDLAWLSCWASFYPAWQQIDFPREVRRHYNAIGLAIPSFGERLRCYELHIALGGQSYSAFRGRWADVELVAERILALARAPLAE